MIPLFNSFALYFLQSTLIEHYIYLTNPSKDYIDSSNIKKLYLVKHIDTWNF